MKDKIAILKDRANLANIIGADHTLKPIGSRQLTGACPECGKDGFQVVPSKGFYHCFDCGFHGDVFTWIMRRDQKTFEEAVEWLDENTV